MMLRFSVTYFYTKEEKKNIVNIYHLALSCFLLSNID